MNQDAAFLASIIENPDDESLRLIYADWLEERNDPRGEFIRVQCELARLPEEDPHWKELWTRSRDLLTVYRDQWLGPLRGFGDNAEFHRGFVDAITIRPERLLEQADDLFRTSPIQRLICQTAILQLASPHLQHPSSGPLMPKLAECRHLARLTALGLWQNRIGDDGLTALSRSPHLRRLTSLVLSCNEIGNAGVPALAASGNFSLLTDLDLSTNGVGLSGAEALASSPFLGGLLSLDLSHNFIRDHAVEALAASPNLREMRNLNLAGNGIGATGIRAILDSPYLGKLQMLNVQVNAVGNKARHALRERFGKGRVKF